MSIVQFPIAHRTYGHSSRNVTILAKEFIKGMKEEGIMITLKHAPGIGSGNKDSHKGKVIINKSKTSLIEHDLVPFTKLSKISDFILASHAIFTDIDGKPTTMSKKTINFFRQNAKFDGFIISDALNMNALREVKSRNSSIEFYQDIAEKIFDAGVDIIITNCLFMSCETGVYIAASRTNASQRLQLKIKKLSN